MCLLVVMGSQITAHKSSLQVVFLHKHVYVPEVLNSLVQYSFT